MTENEQAYSDSQQLLVATNIAEWIRYFHGGDISDADTEDMVKSALDNIPPGTEFAEPFITPRRMRADESIS